MTERVLAHPAEARTTPHRGRAVVTGRRPEAGLYDSAMATYDTGDTVDG